MLYSLRVMRDGELPHQLKLDVSAPEEARLQAEQQGYKVLQVKRVSSSLKRQNKSFSLTLFCHEFRVLLEAGLSMTEVLDTLVQKEESPVNQSHIQQLLRAVEEGQTLSQAMAKLPDIFPTLLVTSVKTAETTGDLPEALLRYNQYSENVDLLKKRIVSASIYPAIVVGFGVLVFMFLMIFVIPKFSNIYQSQLNHTTDSASFILALGSFSEHYAVHALIVFVGFLLLATWAISQSSIRAKLSSLLWRLPYLGEKLRIYHLSRFYRTFAMLLKSGMTVSAGLSLVSGMLGVGLQQNLLKAKRLIGEGKTFTEALDNSGLTTPVAMRLFRVGEKTGALENMMEHAASFHEEQMIRWVDKVTKVFEPALMAGIGILIGGLVLMMYLPIFDLASGIQ